MRQLFLILTLTMYFVSLKAQIKLPGGNLGNTINNAANAAAVSGANLSESDIAKGLKEALSVGTNNSSSLASKFDGYYKNPMLFIPFPPEAQKVKDKVDALGMKEQSDKFVMTLNRAAE